MTINFHALLQLPSQKPSSCELSWKSFFGKNMFERFYLIVQEINIKTNIGFDFPQSILNKEQRDAIIF